MKKILATLMLCVFAVSHVCLYAQATKGQEKEIKARVKELQKEGWKTFGSTSLETSLRAHTVKLSQSEGMMEVTGEAQNMKNTYSGKVVCQDEAVNELANDLLTEVKRTREVEIKKLNEEDRLDLESDLKTETKGLMNGELTPSFYIYRETGKGRYEVRGFFLYDRESLKEKVAQALLSRMQKRKS